MNVGLGELVVIGVVAVAVAAVVVIMRSRRSRDGVDSFRRQIDALSPEARRPVVDQVQRSAERHITDEPEPDSPDDSSVSDEDGDTNGT